MSEEVHYIVKLSVVALPVILIASNAVCILLRIYDYVAKHLKLRKNIFRFVAYIGK